MQRGFPGSGAREAGKRGPDSCCTRAAHGGRNVGQASYADATPTDMHTTAKPHAPRRPPRRPRVPPPSCGVSACCAMRPPFPRRRRRTAWARLHGGAGRGGLSRSVRRAGRDGRSPRRRRTGMGSRRRARWRRARPWPDAGIALSAFGWGPAPGVRGRARWAQARAATRPAGGGARRIVRATVRGLYGTMYSVRCTARVRVALDNCRAGGQAACGVCARAGRATHARNAHSQYCTSYRIAYGAATPPTSVTVQDSTVQVRYCNRTTARVRGRRGVRRGGGPARPRCAGGIRGVWDGWMGGAGGDAVRQAMSQ